MEHLSRVPAMKKNFNELTFCKEFREIAVLEIDSVSFPEFFTDFVIRGKQSK